MIAEQTPASGAPASPAPAAPTAAPVIAPTGAAAPASSAAPATTPATTPTPSSAAAASAAGAPGTPGVPAAGDAPTEAPKNAIAEAARAARAALASAATAATTTAADAATVPAVVPAPGVAGEAAAPEAAPVGPTRDAAGVWRNADGTFASPEAAAAAEASAAAAPSGAPAGGEGAPGALTITLRGNAERGEADVEIPVPDEATAQRLRQLQNDGMRRADYNRQMETVNRTAADFEEFRTALSTNPAAVMLEHLAPTHQLEVARALLVQHFDTLLPELVQLQDPVERRAAGLDLRERLDAGRQAQTQAIAEQRAATQFAGALQRAIDATVPEHAVGDAAEAYVAEAYVADAIRDVSDAVRAGRITPQSADIPTLVAQAVARRQSLYGFAAAAPAPAASPAGPAARPVVPAAVPATPGPVRNIDEARAAQERLRQQQQSRQSAAAVAPAGAGAVPLQAMPVAAGETIQQRIAALKQRQRNA